MIRITRFHMLLISIIVIIAGIYAYQLVQEKERRRVMAAVEAQRQAVREAQQRMIEEERRRQELLNRAETLAIEAVAVAGEYRLISIKENKDVTQGEASLRQAKEFLAKRDFDNAWELAHQSIGQFKAAPVLAVKKAGVNPYPSKFDKQDLVVAIKESADGQQIKTAGRIMTLRLMGKLCFAHLQDFSGKAQIAVKADEVGAESFKFFTENFDLGDFIEAKGGLFKTKRGEPTLLVGGFKMLTKALLPLPEKWHGLADTEIRFRKRYLDLIANPAVGEIFKKRSRLIQFVRNYFIDLGFIEVDTPILQAVASGAIARPFKTHHNALDMDLYLRIAPEIFLKKLIVGGFEKVFTIARNFRNEGIDTSHNPEFTLLEAMTAYDDYKDGMDLVENLIAHALKKALGSAKVKYFVFTIPTLFSSVTVCLNFPLFVKLVLYRR